MVSRSIAPLPTKFNGVEYRSSTEARWAVMFDALGVRYHYEYKEFDLTDLAVQFGVEPWCDMHPKNLEATRLKYLPDFWAESWEMWVEVKPLWRTIEADDAARKLGMLSVLTGDYCLLVVGPPSQSRPTTLPIYYDEDRENSWRFDFGEPSNHELSTWCGNYLHSDYGDEVILNEDPLKMRWAFARARTHRFPRRAR